MNKYVFDSDLPILIGHVQGNPMALVQAAINTVLQELQIEKYCQSPCSGCDASSRFYPFGKRGKPYETSLMK